MPPSRNGNADCEGEAVSDTRRWVQPGWDGILGGRIIQVFHSKKHQTRDRKPFPKGWRFQKGTRNSLYNLRRKINDLRTKEGMTE